MSNLAYFENIIKEKRKKTDFRDFVKEIASWCPLVLNKNKTGISRFPNTDRIKNEINRKIFDENRDSLISDINLYDNTKNFFENFSEFFSKFSFPSLIHYINSENADFSDLTLNSKNIYLSTLSASECENILYSFSVKDHSKNVLNSIMVWDNNENIYMSTWILRSYNIFYSRFIHDSNNIWFSSNLIGCSECFGCDNLQNKSFCINNIQYSKEDYFKFKKDLILKKDMFKNWFQTTLNKKGINSLSSNVSGIAIIESDNVENGYFVYHIRNGRNIISGGTVQGNENIYDALTVGTPYGNNWYGVFSVSKGDNYYLSCHIVGGDNVYYSYLLENCSFCLGCIGLKNKSFCILNKQYTKEEWYELSEKIFTQMEQDGTLGEFFSGELNPFYFNDTMAYLIDDSFTKEEVEKEGYMWREEEIKVDIPENAEIVETKDLNNYQGFDSDGKWYINSEILKKVIKDEEGNVYKIVPMEYEFLMKHGLPLPEIHWLDRIKLGFKF